MSTTSEIITPDNPSVFLTAGIATLDGIIPAENLPVGQGAGQVAAGNDPRFPASPTAVPSLRHEVWISPDRSDDQPGDGTLANPYDGSTQARFDAIMTDDTKVPAHAVIHLLPGTFHTKGGDANVLLKEGWIIRGAGMDLTTLFLDPYAAANRVSHFLPPPDPATGTLNRVEIHDLTLHCNVENQPASSLVQASILCNNGGYYRVRLTHWGNTLNGTQEAFGLNCTVMDTGSHQASPEIQGCIVEAPTYHGGTSLGFNATLVDTTVAFKPSGVVEGNTVYDNFTSNGIALAGRFGGVRVTGNHINRALRGFHQDSVSYVAGNTIPSEDVRVEGNYFESCQVMVGLGSLGHALIRNYVVANNTCTVSSVHTVDYGNYTPFFADSGVTGLTIVGNRVALSATDYDPAHAETIACRIFGGCGDLTIVNNVFDPSLTSGAVINNGPADGTKLIACWGNRYSDGGTIPGLEDRGSSASFDNLSVDGSSSVVREVFSSANLYNGRYRLKMSLSTAPSGYSVHVPAYLVHASTDDGKGYTALVSATRSFYGVASPQLRVVLLDGDGLLYSSSLTTTGGTAYFSVCKPATTASQEIYSFTVTQIGVTAKYSSAAWSVETEDPAGPVAAGTATPNVFPPVTPDSTGKVRALTLNTLAVGAITVGGNYTVAATDPDIEVNASSSTVTLTLHPATGNAGLLRTISNVGSSSNVVTVATAVPDKILDGTASGTSTKTIAPGTSLRLKVTQTNKFAVV